jgi:hypothetical protein
MTFLASVLMQDNTVYEVKRLLGKAESNAKLNKSEKSGKGFMSVGLSLAPHKVSGFNVCPSASKACIADCIYTSGQAAIFRTIPAARIAKTRLFKMNKPVFIDQLLTELGWANRRAKRDHMKLAIRLNVFSDIQWDKEIPNLYNMFSDVIFYDYTKIYNRMVRYVNGELRKNVHLTFSWSGTNKNECLSILDRGSNVAVPFNVKYFSENRQPLPKKFMGYTVIDGDITDLRFLDKKAKRGKRGYIVGLRAKGKGKKDLTSGFIIQPQSSEVYW